ncbi:MAG TPA: V-type ATP synthase subunit D [Spirochaetales bacterium]|jgi:V/A-type H+-transporting ATPase subunit D|nr:V-type ATP synthase subunit D [Spirochaetales bacterium]
MPKIKLTKTELKKQKDALKMYERYLPTLQLKKQQLQIEIRGIEARLSQLSEAKTALENDYRSWIGVFSEEQFARDAQGKPLLQIKSVKTSERNIAGVTIPQFESAEFEFADYDFFSYPLWVDRALSLMQQTLLTDIERSVVEEQKRLLAAELRTTTQRVNLFEKIKIPETEAAIRRIRIYLGDQQVAQVVRGKIAKKKVEESRA